MLDAKPTSQPGPLKQAMDQQRSFKADSKESVLNLPTFVESIVVSARRSVASSGFPLAPRSRAQHVLFIALRALLSVSWNW